jgi:hypothetical protein
MVVSVSSSLSLFPLGSKEKLECPHKLDRTVIALEELPAVAAPGADVETMVRTKEGPFFIFVTTNQSRVVIQDKGLGISENSCASMTLRISYRNSDGEGN